MDINKISIKTLLSGTKINTHGIFKTIYIYAYIYITYQKHSSTYTLMHMYITYQKFFTTTYGLGNLCRLNDHKYI